MNNAYAELDRLQGAYQAAAEDWIAAIRAEAALANVHHSVAQLDAWEGAHFAAEHLRGVVEACKADYESALRSELFGIG